MKKEELQSCKLTIAELHSFFERSVKLFLPETENVEMLEKIVENELKRSAVIAARAQKYLRLDQVEKATLDVMQRMENVENSFKLYGKRNPTLLDCRFDYVHINKYKDWRAKYLA